jgi:hypothetical protein
VGAMAGSWEQLAWKTGSLTLERQEGGGDVATRTR